MSSYTTRVSCAEWNRMKDLIQNEESYKTHNRELVNKIKHEEKIKLQELQDRIDNNNQAIVDATNYITQIGSLAQNEFEVNASQKINNFSQNVSSSLNSILNDVRHQSTVISNINEKINELCASCNSMFNSILSAKKQKHERSEYVLHELDNCLSTAKELHPDVFDSERYSGLVNLRNRIVSLCNNGDFEAAITVSQDCIIDASKLITNLIISNEQYSVLMKEVQNKLADLNMKLIKLSDGNFVFNLDGEELEAKYDINYWSHGRFNIIKEEYTRIVNYLNGLQNKPLPIKEIQCINDQVEYLISSISNCDIDARNELVDSHAIVNVAQQLNESLTDDGWNLQSSGRKDDDDRLPYHMIYNDPSGNSVSFVISSGDKPTEPNLSYEAYSDSIGHADLIKQGVRERLEDAGIYPSEIFQRDDCHSNGDSSEFVDNMSNYDERRILQRNLQNDVSRKI